MPLHIKLVMYSPIIGLAITIILYVHYRTSANSARPLSIFVYFPIVALAGLAGFQASKYAGMWIACTIPDEPGNLCGLFGYFVTGPAGCTLLMILTAYLLIRHARRPMKAEERA